MDPIKEPACAVCGATTGLVGREGHGWVCAVSGSCLARSSTQGQGGTGGFVVDHGSLRFVEPFHREEYDPENKGYFAKLMASCRAIDPDFGKASSIDVGRACDVCGATDEDFIFTRPGYVCVPCFDAPGVTMPDYEALGYLETRVWADDPDEAGRWVTATEGLILPRACEWLGIETVTFRIPSQKDIPASTDIVDSADSDSYK